MSDGRIVGGKPTTIEEHPWQVSIRNFGGHICGGSIIRENLVVSAAHCIDGGLTLFMSIYYGSSFVKNGGEIVGISRLVKHEKYDSSNLNNDIGLLFLKKSLIFGPKIGPVKLPTQGHRMPVGVRALVTGWGALSEVGSSPTQLQEVTVSIIDDNVCNHAVNIVKDTMVCAGDYELGGIDSCQGDSGGPLTISGELQGIVSWGYGCADSKFPSVFSRVSMYRDWIDSH